MKIGKDLDARRLAELLQPQAPAADRPVRRFQRPLSDVNRRDRSRMQNGPFSRAMLTVWQPICATCVCRNNHRGSNVTRHGTATAGTWDRSQGCRVTWLKKFLTDQGTEPPSIVILPRHYGPGRTFRPCLNSAAFFFADFTVTRVPLLFEVDRAADFVVAVFGPPLPPWLCVIWTLSAIFGGQRLRCSLRSSSFLEFRFFFGGFAASLAMLSSSIPKMAPRSLESSPPLPLVLNSPSRFPAAMA